MWSRGLCQNLVYGILKLNFRHIVRDQQLTFADLSLLTKQRAECISPMLLMDATSFRSCLA